MKTSKMTKFIIALSFVLLVSFVGFNIYQNLVNTPKKIFIDAINSLANDYKYFDNVKDNNYNFFNDDFTYTGTIDTNIESSLLNSLKLETKYQNIINSINFLNEFKINYKLQKNDQDLLLDLNGQYKDKNLFFTYYNNNSDYYVKLSNYSDFYIKINDIIEKIKNNVIYLDDPNYLINVIKDSFINNLSDDYFNTKKEEININDEKVNVNKNVLKLDRKNMTTILNQIISDLKNDEKATNMLIDLFPNFETLDIEIADNKDDDIVIYFNTYTENNKLIKYELEITNINYLGLDINNITISFIKNSNIINIIFDDKEVASIHLYNKDNGCDIEFYLNDSKLLTLDVSNEETNKQLSINSGSLLNNNFNFILSEIIDKNILEDYDKIEDKLLFNFNFLGFNLLKLEIINKSNIYDKENIQIDMLDYKNLEELNSEDVDKIKNILNAFFRLQES